MHCHFIKDLSMMWQKSTKVFFFHVNKNKAIHVKAASKVYFLRFKATSSPKL